MATSKLIFVSYSRKDKLWKERVLKQLNALRHQQDLTIWHDRLLETGETWEQKLFPALERASAVILLISENFLSSDFIFEKELPMIRRLREERDEEEFRVLPVIIDDCAWDLIDWISMIQVHPGGGKVLADGDEKEIKKSLGDLTRSIAKWLKAAREQQDGATVPARPITTNLEAVRADRFVGRQREIAEVKTLFDRQSVRLATVTGPPGIGKTRFAREVGRTLLDRFDGRCLFVDLAAAKTVIGIGHAVSRAFGRDLTSSQVEPEAAVLELLRSSGKLLLILDNFEQITDFAEQTVEFWLRRLPHARFLVTSRWRLRIRGEHEYPLPPLPAPAIHGPRLSIEELERNDSIRLFVERVRQYRPQFELDDRNAAIVQAICGELQGLPRAIELVAARARTLALPEIADKLGEKLRFFRADRANLPERERTLYGTFEWSYQLLTEREQHALLQASAFRGGFLIEAAQAVIRLDGADDPDSDSELDAVLSLCEKSLLNRHKTSFGSRFDMYVAVREFGAEKWRETVVADEREAFAFRWAEYYLGYAETYNAKIHSAGGMEALDRLSYELENYFEIQDWFLDEEHRRPEIAAQAILAFAQTMAVRGPAPMRVPRLEKSLAALGDDEPELRARLMTALSQAHWATGDWNRATELADQAVDLLEPQARHPALAWALRQQGQMRTNRGFLRRALRSCDAARRIFETLDDKVGLSVIETDVGSVLDRLGDFDGSIERFRRAKKLTETIGDDAQRAMVMNRMGLAFWHHGKPRLGVECLEEAWRINEALDLQSWVGAHQTNSGLALADMDDFDRALECFETAERIHREFAHPAWAAVNYGGWGRALMMRNQPGDIDRALELIARAEKLSKEVYYPENLALHRGDRGRALLMLGRIREARRAVRYAVGLERTIGASQDARHFNNLVTLARIDQQLDNLQEARETIVRATTLARRLALSRPNPVPKIDQDLAHLEDLLQALGLPADVTIGRAIEQTPGLRPPWQGAGIRLNAEQIDELGAQMVEAWTQPGYEYPWHGIEEDLREQGTTFKLFGYGSLVNPESVRKTFPDIAPEKLRPVIAFGVIRLFNYEMPEAVARRYAVPENPADRGLLNVRFSGAMSDCPNGFLVELDIDEINALRRRERGYDLRPVQCLPWGASGEPPILAYTLGCPDRRWLGRRLTDSEILPHRDYYELCRAGAAQVSDAFLDYWLRTTFLANGETSAAEWESQRSGAGTAGR